MNTWQISANYVNIPEERIYPAHFYIKDHKIERIETTGDQQDPSLPYILPGFIDAHVHIESSMLVPSEFARLASTHGTVATISDPHEIANVMGVEGINFMIENGKEVPFKFFFGAPSCVPATPFETAGAAITAKDITSLLAQEEIYYLSEMMNFPGVLHHDEEVDLKIKAALESEKPIDGHAPGLKGMEAQKYAEAGYPGKTTISTDHECFTKEEALDKLEAGMKIIIREGSAARNFDALIDLLQDYPDRIMFCSDDKHPDSLEAGHINQLVIRALKHGIPLFHILKAACLNPVLHYHLPIGQLRKNDPADFIIVQNLKEFKILATYVNGEKIAENGETCITSCPVKIINNFHCQEKKPLDFAIEAHNPIHKIKVINAVDGELITNILLTTAKVKDGFLVSDPENDILKITVVNRYENKPPAMAFIKNFGINGAIASSVAHDSHNIIAIGSDDTLLCKAVNLIIKNKGGICAVDNAQEKILPLPIAGLMSDKDGYDVADTYDSLDRMAKEMGSTLGAPFMTLSFMALLVIPHLKLSDKGLFNGDEFRLEL